MDTLHLFTIPPWINHSYFVGVALTALWRGDWRARAVGACHAVSLLAGIYVCHTLSCWSPTGLQFATWRWLAEDLPVLVVCLACAWRAERYWVLWASSFSMLAVISDLMGGFPGISAWSGASADLVWNYGLITTVLIGVLTQTPRNPPVVAIRGPS